MEFFMRFTAKGNFRHNRRNYPGGSLVPFTKEEFAAEIANYKARGIDEAAMPFEDPGDKVKRLEAAAESAKKMAAAEIKKAGEALKDETTASAIQDEDDKAKALAKGPGRPPGKAAARSHKKK